MRAESWASSGSDSSQSMARSQILRTSSLSSASGASLSRTLLWLPSPCPSTRWPESLPSSLYRVVMQKAAPWSCQLRLKEEAAPVWSLSFGRPPQRDWNCPQAAVSILKGSHRPTQILAVQLWLQATLVPPGRKSLFLYRLRGGPRPASRGAFSVPSMPTQGQQDAEGCHSEDPHSYSNGGSYCLKCLRCLVQVPSA